MSKIDRVSRGLLQGMKLQLERCVYHDVEVKVKGQKFPSHKFVLAACSNYFRGRFIPGVKDIEVVELPRSNISFRTFNAIHNFIYSGRIEITENNITDLWRAAHQLQIDVLLQECELFQERRLCRDNCVDIFNIAQALDCQSLSNLSWDIIVREFEFLRQNDDLLSLAVDDITRLVGNDRLPVKSEDVVIDLIERWCLVESEKDERVSVVHKVLAAAKICLASTSCLLNVIRNDDIQKNVNAFKMLQEGTDYIINLARRHDYCPTACMHRSISDLQNVLVSLTSDYDQTALSVRTREGTWFVCASPGENFHKGSLVAFGDFLFAINSVEGNSLIKFNTQTNSWTSLKSPIEPGANYSLVADGEYIYAIGGNDGDNIERINALTAIEKPESSEWESVTKLVHPVTHFSLLAMGNNSIVVFGRKKHFPDEAVVQRVDIRNKTCDLIINDVPGVSESSVCLKDKQNNFLLQQDGSLWRVIDCDGTTLDMVYEAGLWDDDMQLHGASICHGELLVMATVNNGSEPRRKWSMKKDFFFSRVTIIKRNGCGLVNAVMPKSLWN